MRGPHVFFCLVVITTAHDHNVTDHHIVEQDSGDCVETQVTPKAHHPNEPSGPEHGVFLNGQHPINTKPIANGSQYDDLRSIGELHVEGLAAVAQSPPEDFEGISPLVLDDHIAQEASEGISPQSTEINYQKTT